MLLIQKEAYARAGLIGNPSDGYNGRTISVSVRNFRAKVTLYEWDEMELILSQEDQSRFRSVHELARDVRLHGYYGGIRLVKATIKKFVEYCTTRGLKLHEKNFSVRYESNIPRQVGLAGSSAIIVATLRALIAFYDLDIPLQVQPSLVLSVEREELGIAAGLQDRVIQVYEGCVYMDFSSDRMQMIDGYECGQYERLSTDSLPPLYIAYNTDIGEPTEIFHNNLRARFESGDSDVLQAMQKLAEITKDARNAVLIGDAKRLAALIDENFDLRRSICQIPREQEEMVDVARSVGCSAKFAGSGGAIIGTFPDESSYHELCRAMEGQGCRVIRPVVEG